MAQRREMKRILNVLPSQHPDDDWQFDTAITAGVAVRNGVPDKVDLCQPTWWTIGDQGGTGSCVGWATADSLLRWHFVQANRLTETEPLSVRYIWMAAKETDEFSQRPTTFIEQDG